MKLIFVIDIPNGVVLMDKTRRIADNGAEELKRICLQETGATVTHILCRENVDAI
jgi:hypothetical protein